jgi:plastocyanin
MRRKLLWLVLFSAVISFSPAIHPQSWRAIARAQSPDKATQALAFFPNDIWIHAGESITWTFAADEHHSVTFLKPGQVRPTYTAGARVWHACANLPCAAILPDSEEELLDICGEDQGCPLYTPTH